MHDNLPSDLINIKEAARIVHNTHHATIRRWVLTGKLRGYKLAGRKFLVSRADVIAMIQPVDPKALGVGPSGHKASKRHQRDVERLREMGLM